MSKEGCRPFIEITNNIDDEVFFSTRNFPSVKYFTPDE
jgi:hypothetical protein